MATLLFSCRVSTVNPSPNSAESAEAVSSARRRPCRAAKRRACSPYILSGSVGLIADWLLAKQTAPAEDIAAKISRLNGAVLAFARQKCTETDDTSDIF